MGERQLASRLEDGDQLYETVSLELCEDQEISFLQLYMLPKWHSNISFLSSCLPGYSSVEF